LRPVVYQFDTKKFDEFLLKGTPDSIIDKRMKEIDYSASTQITHTGFIAQEVEQIMEETGYDFSGLHRPIDENDNYSVSYSQFVVPLVKAVQELKAENDAYQIEVEQLKAQLVQQNQENTKRFDALEEILKTANQ
jgi:hypothetical protein